MCSYRASNARCSAHIERCDELLDLVLTFSGHYDQGTTWGRPEDCCPAEGEIRFDMVSVNEGAPQDFDAWSASIGLTDCELATLEESAFCAMYEAAQAT